MYYTAIKVKFLEGVKMEVTYQDGKIIVFDMESVFNKYPQFKQLKSDRTLFENGHLDFNGSGIIWNDELDIDVGYIYDEGTVIKQEDVSINYQIGSL